MSNETCVHRRIAVLLPLPLAGAYDYVDPGLGLDIGDCVEVPLGSRHVAGVVIGEGTGEIAAERLKPVSRRFDVPALPAVSLRFLNWVAAYTISPAGSVLRMAISVPAAFEPPAPVRTYSCSQSALPAGFRITTARRRVLELLAGTPPMTLQEITTLAGVSSSVVSGLAAAGAIERTLRPRDPPPDRPDPDRPRTLTFNQHQNQAAERLIGAIGQGYSVTVLDGVTGAGKTEVYFEAVAEALRQDRQVLILLPEIALSAAFLDRFESRFGARPAEWHSDLAPTMRRRTWRNVADGSARVLVGARSALFLPFPDLGLIVVDEEHESAFKQGDGVIYQGRDMAVVRSRLGEIPIILVSATLSLETITNIRRNRYAQVSLPARHSGATLPEVTAIDLRSMPPNRRQWLAPALDGAVRAALERGEQALLFLNRRGYAPLTLCRKCGHRIECPNCSTWLVEHRLTGRLQCHHCGYACGRPATCPECATPDSLVPCGPGVERLAEEVSVRYPGARMVVASSDTLSGPHRADEFVRSVNAGEVDIIIGTQIIAKGYHFPLLTVVGVIDADLGLAGGDLRAAERTYQLLHQVAGRAGRESRAGHVFLQTHLAESPVMQALINWDRDGFLQAEAEARSEAGMPPFGKLVAFVVSSRDPDAAGETARMLARTAPHPAGVRILGPAPAPLARLRGRHRWRLLLKAERDINVQKIVRDWIGPLAIPGSVRVSVDVDPYGFL